MKTKFNIGKIEIEGVVVENISIEAEYSLSEATGAINFGKRFMQELIEETPAMLESLERAFNKFNEIDDRVERQEQAKETSKSEEFHAAFTNNMDNIKKLAAKGNMLGMLQNVSNTRRMCQKAISKKHISEASYESCMNELMELLEEIGIQML